MISADQGFGSWSRAGVVLPDLLKAPYGGRRKLTIVLRIINADNDPEIFAGFCDPNHPGTLAERVLEFEHTFTEKGYEEAVEHRDEARALSIKIGMAVAMADGSLDDSEGEVLKTWTSKAIAPFNEEKRSVLKSFYNEAMREAYDDAKDGNLVLSDLTAKLNVVAEKPARHETIELCFDIMAADGVADPEEMRTIRKIAETLELDFSEIEKLRDQKLVGLDTQIEKMRI
jgi:uncharacterized tellurite resistance protein B-like protein